jgi:hypothetical protein
MLDTNHAAIEAVMAPTSANRLDVDHGEYLLPPLEEAKRRHTGAGSAGSKLWLNGGYTYLATRRKEYQSLARDSSSEWSTAFCEPGTGGSIAELAAAFLVPTGRPFESLIHGDVKSENLFTTVQEDRVAFYDFQYVGLGLGVCDLAKLFTCSVPPEMLTGEDDMDLPDRLTMDEGERSLLEEYRKTLLRTTKQAMHDGEEDVPLPYDDWDVLVRHWETALVDWCRFQASWGFWGNTEWLEARTRSILTDEGWREWLASQMEADTT